MKRVASEIGLFLAVWVFVSVIFSVVKFSYELWPVQLFFGLSLAVIWALYRFATWAFKAGGLK